MTDRIAFILAGIIALAVVADLAVTGGGVLLYLARKMVDLIALVSFWR